MCFRLWRHLQLGPAFTRVWVVVGSPNSSGHPVPGAEVHTVSDQKGREPLLSDTTQVTCMVFGSLVFCVLWPLPTLPSLALNTHHTHTHTTPQFLTHCITLQRQWMTFRSQDKPHVLSCLRVFLCLEYSSLVYYAFSPHPQPPWPETPTRPSSLSVDVAFPRNPSLSASPQDW